MHRGTRTDFRTAPLAASCYAAPSLSSPAYLAVSKRTSFIVERSLPAPARLFVGCPARRSLRTAPPLVCCAPRYTRKGHWRARSTSARSIPSSKTVVKCFRLQLNHQKSSPLIALNEWAKPRVQPSRAIRPPLFLYAIGVRIPRARRADYTIVSSGNTGRTRSSWMLRIFRLASISSSMSGSKLPCAA